MEGFKEQWVRCCHKKKQKVQNPTIWSFFLLCCLSFSSPTDYIRLKFQIYVTLSRRKLELSFSLFIEISRATITQENIGRLILRGHVTVATPTVNQGFSSLLYRPQSSCDKLCPRSVLHLSLPQKQPYKMSNKIFQMGALSRTWGGW